MEKDIREILKAESQETQVGVVARLGVCDTATSLLGFRLHARSTPSLWSVHPFKDSYG